MTADVAAAAGGLLAAGADEVVVLDNHGSGNPENMLGDELPDGRPARDLERLRPPVARGRRPPPGRLPRPGRCAGVHLAHLRARAAAAGRRRADRREPRSGLGVRRAAARDRRERRARADARVAGRHSVPRRPADGRDRHASRLRRETPAGRSLRSPRRPCARAAACRSAPCDLLFEASLAGRRADPDPQRRRLAAQSETEFAVELASWRDAREPLAAAMGAAIVPWLRYFAGFDLTSQAAAEAVHDERCCVRAASASMPGWASLSPSG